MLAILAQISHRRGPSFAKASEGKSSIALATEDAEDTEEPFDRLTALSKVDGLKRII